MADNASTARPYAKAVFELAQETNAYEAWALVLGRLADISADESFSSITSDPRIEQSQVVDVLTDLTKDVLPEGGTNFIKLIVQNARVSSIADIQHLYTDLVAKAQASVNATVVSAIALTDAQKSSLESALRERVGLNVKREESVDADLIGGAIIKAGDLVIDGSAKGRIEKLATALR
jgi:F-type H+-transporting ATPase subunit delta